MNERIRELAIEVMRSDPEPHLTTELYSFTKSEFQKFSELLIRECLFIIDDERKPDMVNRTELWKQIKQHFGVEEDEAFNCPMCGLQNPTTSCGLPNCGLIAY